MRLTALLLCTALGAAACGSGAHDHPVAAAGKDAPVFGPPADGSGPGVPTIPTTVADAGGVPVTAEVPAEPPPLWAGDFETGNLEQWTSVDRAANDRVVVVANPSTEGTRAAKFTVRYGDDVNSGERAEVVYAPAGADGAEGRERWYRWWTMWDASYPSSPTWQLFTQWHHTGLTGSPPIEFLVQGEEILLNTRRCSTCDPITHVLDTTLVRGVWHEFVAHIKWSSNASVGFVEVWYDGSRVVPLQRTVTLYPKDTTYLKQGLYRDAQAIRANGVVYHDGMTISDEPLAPGSDAPGL
jgi:hypothetical protein